MQKSASLTRNSSTNNSSNSSLKVSTHQSLRRLGLCSQIATGSPIVFPEKRSKVKAALRKSEVVGGDNQKDSKGGGDSIGKRDEHRIDIVGGDEKSDLLGYVVFTGKLGLDKRKKTSKGDSDGLPSTIEVTNQESAFDAKLSSKALVWGSHILSLDYVISVTYYAGLRHFTLHSYPVKKPSCGLSCFIKAKRNRKDFRFLASSPEEALRWVSGFADQQCFINCYPHPMLSAKKQASSEFISTDIPFELQLKCKTPPRMLVILNPRSGRGRSSKVFHNVVEPIFKRHKVLSVQGLRSINSILVWKTYWYNRISLLFPQLFTCLHYWNGTPLHVCWGHILWRGYIDDPQNAFSDHVLAGFKMEVVKTTSAGHAKSLASSVDFSTCPDGIICVGGDGIVNEVLNGLLSRDNQKEAISVPIGIIPAGSDNSLVWTVLGVRDPISAAIAIVKGGLTATDVFAVEWIQTGVIHFGMTVSYFGFVSDVLELSEKYQKRFGPLRYFVAGFLKFLCMTKYSFEVDYLPASKETLDPEGKFSGEKEIVDMSDLYTDIMRRSNTEGIPRASSLSSIDSIMTPSRVSGAEDTTGSNTHASTEPSEYVRGIDPKSKRLSSGRNVLVPEQEVLHSQLPLSVTPNWSRNRSRSRTDKAWAGLTATHDPSRGSWGNAVYDKEDISSTMSDPGPIWDAEPRWDVDRNWDLENPIELPGPTNDHESEMQKEAAPRYEEKWITTKGSFLGILVCNHSCKTVQSLSSQVVAPKAEHDDNTLDLLLVHGSGRFRLLRFFLLLQFGRHLTLPYVEYIKVKSVKIKPGKNTQSGCGIDGELVPVNGQLISSLLPEQCRLIGRAPIVYN